MEKITNEHINLILDYINILKKGLIDNRKLVKKILSDAIKNKTGDELFFPIWNYLYELPIIYTSSLFFHHLEIIQKIDFLKDSKKPNLDLLNLGINDDFIDQIELKESPENLQMYAVFMHVLDKNIMSIKQYGLHIHELLEKGKKGDDESFFRAIRIDRTIIQSLSISERIMLAEINNDKKFITGLRNALKGKQKWKWKIYDDTRIIAKVLMEAEQMPVGIEELYKIFCKDFSLYSTKGNDPARNLHQFIYRFRKESST